MKGKQRLLTPLFLGHGSPGKIDIGTSEIDLISLMLIGREIKAAATQEAVNDLRLLIKMIKKAVNPGGQIELVACNVADTPAQTGTSGIPISGIPMMQELARQTGLQVSGWTGRTRLAPRLWWPGGGHSGIGRARGRKSPCTRMVTHGRKRIQTPTALCQSRNSTPNSPWAELDEPHQPAPQGGAATVVLT